MRLSTQHVYLLFMTSQSWAAGSQLGVIAIAQTRPSVHLMADVYTSKLPYSRMKWINLLYLPLHHFISSSAPPLRIPLNTPPPTDGPSSTHGIHHQQIHNRLLLPAQRPQNILREQPTEDGARWGEFGVGFCCEVAVGI